MIGGLVALFGGVLLIQHTVATPGNFSLGLSSSSVQNGNNMTVNVRVNPGTAIDTIDASLTYDQSKLQFVSVNSAGSAFPLELTNSGGDGSVSMIRFITGDTVSGDSFVAQVTFKALAGSGSTGLSVSGTGVLAGAATTPDNGTATVNLTTPSAPNPTPSNPSPTTPSTPSTPSQPSGGGGNSGGSGGGGSNSGGNSGGGSNNGGSANNGGSSTGKPVKVDIKKKHIEFTRAIFGMSSSTKFRVYIKYGLENQLLAQTSLTGFGNDHEVSLDPNVVLPGSKFSYQVIAEDEQGNKTELPVENFKTKGYHVRMYLVDKFEKPLRHKKVVMHSDPVEGTTDESGAVMFEDVAPGNHKVEYKQDGKVYSQEVTVKGQPIKTTEDGAQAADPVQQLTAFQDLAVVENSNSPLLAGSIVAVMVLIAAVAFVFLRRKKPLTSSWPGSGDSGAAVLGPINTPPPSDPGATLVEKATGLQKPDPGSVVNPNQKEDKDK